MCCVTVSTAAPAVRLLSRAHLPFVVGAVALVTLGAFENRATTTVLPAVAERLDGLWLFGAAAAAPLVSYVVATSFAGTWSDRRGPVPALYAGMLLFVASQLLLGAAPAMPVFVAGRLGSGLAEALLDVGLTVLVARALPEASRPKVFAAFAAAWVLPSLVGPSVAGAVAEAVGWRAVFLLGAALLVPVWLLLRPSIRRAAPGTMPGGRWSAAQRRSATSALGLAGALAALSGAGALATRHGGVAVTGAALGLLAVAVLPALLRTQVPVGTARLAPGIPAVVALRGLVAAAFGTVGALIPLMLTVVHGFGPAAAGISLSVTGVCWAAGSQLHGLAVVQRRVTPAARLRVGFALITVGVLGPALTAVGVVPVWLALVLWGVAGLGMGGVSPTLSTQLLALSPVAEQGRNTAASALTGSVSQAVALAVVGAGIAWQAPALPGWLFAVGMGAGAAVGVVGLLGAGRAR